MKELHLRRHSIKDGPNNTIGPKGLKLAYEQGELLNLGYDKVRYALSQHPEEIQHNLAPVLTVIPRSAGSDRANRPGVLPRAWLHAVNHARNFRTGR